MPTGKLLYKYSLYFFLSPILPSFLPSFFLSFFLSFFSSYFLFNTLPRFARRDYFFLEKERTLILTTFANKAPKKYELIFASLEDKDKWSEAFEKLSYNANK